MKFACSICNYQSSVKVNVERHINKINKCGEGIAELIEIPIEISCEYCNKLFNTESSMKRHLKICKIKEIHEVDKKDNEIKLLKQKLEEMSRQLTLKSNTTSSTSSISNFIYLLQEREFLNTGENIYKIGITESLHNRMGHYPKGSKIFCVIPVSGDPEALCLFNFRQKFVSRIDIGSEYFEGNLDLMIKELYQSCS